jgi:hypothetical protein
MTTHTALYVGVYRSDETQKTVDNALQSCRFHVGACSRFLGLLPCAFSPCTSEEVTRATSDCHLVDVIILSEDMYVCVSSRLPVNDGFYSKGKMS